MNYTAYGVKISSPITLPLSLPDYVDVDHSVELKFNVGPAARQLQLPYPALTVNMHGRDITLASSLPIDKDRANPKRRWQLTIGDLFSISWENSSEKIEINSTQQPDLNLVAFWLLHTALPVYLMLRETSLFLHASSIAIDGEAVLFTAPSFGGKSTMVDYFTRQGFNLLSDDKTRLRTGSDANRAYPAHPYRRPFRKFEVLGEYSDNFECRSLPVNSIFSLNLVDPHKGFKVTRIAGLEKFELVKEASLYGSVSLTEPVLKEILKTLSLCDTYRIDLPEGLENLPAALELILKHVRKSV